MLSYSPRFFVSPGTELENSVMRIDSYRTPSTPIRFSRPCTSSVVVGKRSSSWIKSFSLYFPRLATYAEKTGAARSFSSPITSSGQSVHKLPGLPAHSGGRPFLAFLGLCQLCTFLHCLPDRGPG